MQVVDFPHLAPSVCVVCESANEGTPMVDTARNLEVGGWPMNGRKYLCHVCASDAAHALGVFDKERDSLNATIHSAGAEIEALKDRIEELTHIEAAIERLSAKPKPEPRKKAEPKKETPKHTVEETYPLDGVLPPPEEFKDADLS